MPLAPGAHHYTFPFPVLCAVPRVLHSCAQHCRPDCNLWAPAGKETELQSCAEVGPAVLPVLNLFVFHLGQNTQIQVLKISAIASLVSCHRMKIWVWGRRVMRLFRYVSNQLLVSKNVFTEITFCHIQIPDYRNAVIVAKSPDAAKR